MKKKYLIFIVFIVVIFLISLATFVYNKKYDIPRIWFEGDISNMTSKADVRNIWLKYGDGFNTFESYAKIKIQGTSSLAYDKKNYTIELYNDDNYELENKVDVGWGKQSKYCLKANWIDKTHARNIVSANIASTIQKKYNLFEDSPNNGLIDGFPVEIYINGDFLGIYTWNIPKDAWMFNMDEKNQNHIVFASEEWNDTNLFLAEANYNDWSIEVGKQNDENLAKLNRLINFINNSSDEEFIKDFDNYLNFDSTINYLIMTEFALLADNVAKNMLLATYDGEIWYPSLYDLDTSWGTKYTGLALDDYTKTDNVLRSRLWERVIELFPNEISNRYFELKKDILNKKYILKQFNKFKANIPERSFEKENDLWKNIPGYDYSQIEDFLNTRIPIIDKIMTERKTLD